MKNGWTEERRQRQSEAIRTWKPWESSTGPRTPEGKARVSRNAWKGGHRKQLRDLIRMINAEVLETKELTRIASFSAF